MRKNPLHYVDWMDIYECQIESAFQLTTESEYATFEEFAKEKYESYVASFEEALISEAGY